MLLTRHWCLQTRSGNTFSPWAPGTMPRTIMPLDAASFDFESLVMDAVAKESDLDDDDTEGYNLDPATPPVLSPHLSQLPPWSPFSSPTPLSPVPDEFIQLPQSGPSSASAPVPSLPLGTLSTPIVPAQPQFPRAPREGPKYTHGSTEDIRRKKRGKAKRAVKRLQEQRAAPYGLYVVKPALLNRHARPATAVTTGFDTTKLGATKNGWTGTRDQGGYKRVFTLDEMVGEKSIFKFRLERWGGV
jgi:hypothetical protein